jgi:hypothetical protein
MQSVRKFFNELLSSGTEVSSKRVAALFTLLNLLAFCWFTLLKSEEHVLPQFMFDALALVVGGGLGLTVFEKLVTKSSDSSNTQNTQIQEPPTPPAEEPTPIDEQINKN